MKRLITVVCCTALMFSTGMTAHTAEMLDRDYIETEIWEDMWNGKGDDGTIFPEASYKHYLLDKWIDDNYGSDEYDWTELGELKYEYKRYYQKTIEDWDFNDDNNGNWTIETPKHSYSFSLHQGTWDMTDENGDTVTTFPPFSTLKKEEDSTNGYEIHDNGADSPRVIGKVTDGAEKPSDGTETAEGTDTAESVTSSSDGERLSYRTTEHSGANPLLIVGAVVAVTVISGVGFFITRKRGK